MRDIIPRTRKRRFPRIHLSNSYDRGKYRTQFFRMHTRAKGRNSENLKCVLCESVYFLSNRLREMNRSCRFRGRIFFAVVMANSEVFEVWHVNDLWWFGFFGVLEILFGKFDGTYKRKNV